MLRFYGVSITCFGFSIFPWHSSASLWFTHTYIHTLKWYIDARTVKVVEILCLCVEKNGNTQSNFMRRHPKSFRYHYHYGYFINERNVKIWFRCQCRYCILHCIALCVCAAMERLHAFYEIFCFFPSFCAHFIHAQTKRDFHSENIVYHFSWALYLYSFVPYREQQSIGKVKKNTARGEMRQWWDEMKLTDETINALDSSMFRFASATLYFMVMRSYIRFFLNNKGCDRVSVTGTTVLFTKRRRQQHQQLQQRKGMMNISFFFSSSFFFIFFFNFSNKKIKRQNE